LLHGKFIALFSSTKNVLSPWRKQKTKENLRDSLSVEPRKATRQSLSR
jgi:hypothetical protein